MCPESHTPTSWLLTLTDSPRVLQLLARIDLAGKTGLRMLGAELSTPGVCRALPGLGLGEREVLQEEACTARGEVSQNDLSVT